MRATIKLKLTVTFAIIIALSAAMAWLGISNLGALNDSMDQLLRGPVERAQLAAELYTDLVALSRAERSLILAPTEELAKHYEEEIADSRKALLERRERLDMLSNAEGKLKLAAFASTWTRYIGFQDTLRGLARTSKEQAIEIAFGTAKKSIDEAKAQLAAIAELNKTQMRAAQEEANRQYERARMMLLVVVAVSLVIAVGAGVWILLNISRGLARAGSLADAVAIGDLEQKIAVKSNDEIKDLVDALTRMTDNLRKTAQAADTVASGDLRIEVTPLSDKDTLGLSLKSMVERLRGVVGDA